MTGRAFQCFHWESGIPPRSSSLRPVEASYDAHPSVHSLGGEALSEGDVLASEHADVWLVEDGVIRVRYHDGPGTEDLEHVTAVLKAVADCAGSRKRPIVVISHGILPDRDAMRYHFEAGRSLVEAIAVVVADVPVAGATAKLIASQLRSARGRCVAR